jgi:predicted peptidase
MLRSRRLLVAAFAAGLATPAAAADGPGVHRKMLHHDGGELRYTVSIPEGAGPHPLVLSLHFAGQVTPWYGEGLVRAVMIPGLAAVQPVVVAPDCPGRGWDDPVSVAAVAALLDHATRTYAVDGRTLVTGYSMGGMGTWTMVQALPGRFAAAIPMAGRPPESVEGWSVPLYALHSREDELIGPGPAVAAVERLQGAGAPVRLKLVDGITHYQTERFADVLAAAVPWLREVWDRMDPPPAPSQETSPQ